MIPVLPSLLWVFVAIFWLFALVSFPFLALNYSSSSVGSPSLIPAPARYRMSLTALYF